MSQEKGSKSLKANGHTKTTSNSNEFHELSKWQEQPRDDTLTLWEVNRPPRRPKRMQKDRIRCPTKVLDSIFKCAICLDYITETTMVMECLHRFCGECIQKCLRVGMKECPTCRAPIPSRRSLKCDHNFDQIIHGMIGTKTDREENQEQEKQNVMVAVQLQKAILEKKRQDEELEEGKVGGADRPTHGKVKRRRRSTKSINKFAVSSRTISNLELSELVEIELRRHPREGRVSKLDRPFITLRKDARMSILKGFLREKLEPRDYELSAQLDDDSVVLDDDLTLLEAQSALLPTGSRNDVMVFKYKLLTDLHAQDSGDP